MTKFVSTVLAATALTLSLTDVASADHHNVYACYARFYSASGGSYGNHGLIIAGFNSEPGCGGSFVAAYYICSDGATSSNCSYSSYARGNDVMMAMKYRTLVDGMNNDQAFDLYTNWCVGNTGTCLYHAIATAD